MDTQWMGRYRPLISALVQHANINLKLSRHRSSIGEGVELTSVEWQVLEAIIENQDEQSMIGISEKLGIPQSTFSRTVKSLCDLELAEKYQTEQNRKNILLSATPKALRLYQAKLEDASFGHFKHFFADLSSISDEDLRIFVHALNRFNAALTLPHEERNFEE